MKKNIIKIISLCLLIVLVGIVSKVYAATPEKGSIVIHKYEAEDLTKYTTPGTGEAITIDGSSDSTLKPLAGVKFSIYKVGNEDTLEASNAVETLTTNYSLLKESNKTDSDGIVTIGDLEEGRYLVIETTSPDNVSEPVKPFLVDVPTTNPTGDGLIWNVNVYPKNQTVYGAVKLTVTDKNKSDIKVPGVKYILYRDLNEDGEYDSGDKQVKITNKLYDSLTDDTELITDDNGDIIIGNLPKGKYYFIQVDTVGNYILNNEKVIPFEITKSTDISNPLNISQNVEDSTEEPTISKSVTNCGSNSDVAKIAEYKIEISIPKDIKKLKTFSVKDILPTGIVYKSDSLKVKLEKDSENKDLTKDTDYTFDESTNTVSMKNTVDYGDYKKIVITYKTNLTAEANYLTDGNENIAKLTFSNIVSTNYKGEENTDSTKEIEAKAKVYSGGFYILKTDNAGNPLSGAKFHIKYSSDGECIKDESGADVELVTDSQGITSYCGLQYGTYYLDEFETPTYVENGEIKHYNKLVKAQKIDVGNNTYDKQNPIVIINKKGLMLPQAGGLGLAVFIISGLGLIMAGIVILMKRK